MTPWRVWLRRVLAAAEAHSDNESIDLIAEMNLEIAIGDRRKK